MNRQLKFKRAYFVDEAKTQFSHFSEWGVDGTSFCGPASNNFAMYYEDVQFTGLIDRYGVEIYEGDIVARAGYKPSEIWYEDGGYLIGIRGKNDHHFYQISAGQYEVIGNIFRDATLLK